MKTVIVLLSTSDGTRKNLENIENSVFTSVAELKKELRDGIVYSLSDFVDACNNQDIESLESFWIGYVKIENFNSNNY